jgi:hypothetical protein
MVDVVSVDPLMLEKTILDVVAVAVVCMVLPVNVDTFKTIALRAAKFELRDV